MEASRHRPSRPRGGDPAGPAAAPPGPPATRVAGAADAKPAGKADQIKVIGGLIALSAGLAALLLVLVISKWVEVDSNQFTQLAAAVVGVIGSIVGAYFGVKIGTDGTQKALESQRQEAARAQIFAAHLDPEVAKDALKLAFPAPASTAAAGGKPAGDRPEAAPDNPPQ